MLKSIIAIPLACQQCNGECWVAGNQRKTQQNALNRFGHIPNNCINDSNGRTHCPAASGSM